MSIPQQAYLPMPSNAASGSGSSSRMASSPTEASGSRVSSRSGAPKSSSRRTRGSTGPAVLLGGGAGILGSASARSASTGPSNSGNMKQNVPTLQVQGQVINEPSSRAPSPFLTIDPSAPQTASPRFPIHFASPTTPTFPSPVSPAFPNSIQRAPSPLMQRPPSPMVAPIQHQAAQRRAPSPKPTEPLRLKGSPRTSSSVPPLPGSTNSLSTTASTSSRTLKTPHSKLDHHNAQEPTIVSSSSLNSHDTHHQQSPTPAMPIKARNERAKIAGRSQVPDRNGAGSPTPAQKYAQDEAKRSMESARPTKKDESTPPPPLTREPLPPTPPNRATRAASAKHASPKARSPPRQRQPPPAPLILHNKKESRLSQDWVDIGASVDFGSQSLAPRQSEERAKSTSPLIPEGARVPVMPTRARLPAAQMIPMKSTDESPSRPGFGRANTAPQPNENDARAERQGRGSLDALRATNQGPASVSSTPRLRQNSHSTPPQAMLDYFQQTPPSSGSSRMGLFRNDTTAGKNPSPQLKTRRSEDALRPTAEQAASRKDGKNAQLRGLGMGEASVMPDIEGGERKSSGLSLKKSSGALKALFGRGASGKGKDKDRSETPPMPILDHSRAPRERQSSAPILQTTRHESPRPSLNLPSRPWTPGSSAPTKGATNSPQARSLQIANSTPKSGDVGTAGRASFGAERAMYPAPPLQRTVSQGAQPALMVPNRQRLPTRELPELPPPSPVPVAEAQHQVAPSSTKPPVSAIVLGEPVPTTGATGATNGVLPSSSLPYLAALRASYVEPSKPTVVSKIVDEQPAEDTESTSPNLSSASTAKPSPLSVTSVPSVESPMKTSKSLHLLQLPDLDLDFDFAFDKFGASPSTPQKNSPQKSRLSPNSPTPQRSLTTRVSPSRPSPRVLSRNNSERRRSKSFDGPDPRPFLGDIWNEVSTSSSTSTSPAPISSFASHSMIRLLTSPPSASAPDFATEPMEPTSKVSEAKVDEEATTQVADPTALESDQSAPSSLDYSHDQTPSGASSSCESPSPSPPHTPEERTTRQLDFGFDPEFDNTSSTPTPPPHQKVIKDQTEPQPFMHNMPPNIPLPALPTAPALLESPMAKTSGDSPKMSLQPSAVIESAKVQVKPMVEEVKQSGQKIRPARKNVWTLTRKVEVVTPDSSMTTLSIAQELGRVLFDFLSPSAVPHHVTDRVHIVRTQLLPLVAEIDKRYYDSRPTGEEASSKRILREKCFEWIDTLFFELQVEQPAGERGACLEGFAAILESACLSELAIEHDYNHVRRFKDVMIRCMSFVMSKLGAKGVFHNTLLFSGRFLAFAFFRVPHIGEQLVTVLQPPRGALMRFTRAALLGTSMPVSAQPQYPKHLKPLCFDDSRSYTTRLAGLAPEFNNETERDAFLFQPGNWLRRWQSDDSELFPAFYRAYHRQLAIFLGPAIEHYQSQNKPLPASVLLRAPGYAHLATIFAKKCHSYILGSVNAVTTSSSSHHFEATETAGFRGSQKPAVLETANRRLVETITTFTNLKVMVPDAKTKRVISCHGEMLYTGIIDLWVKSLISKTSLYAPKGCFSLFDMLDGIVDPPLDPLTGERRLKETSLLDVPHLIHVIRLILTEGEHALTIVKTIAFVFTHWEVLTARAEDRRELCLELLLEKPLFERLLLFWSQSVRSYVLRLVVFRLGHLHTKKEDGIAHDLEMESVQLLQTRLDRIKKRHDQLEPKAASEAEDEADKDDDLFLTPIDGVNGMPRSRSTITMVAESPRTGSVNKAEKLLGLGFGNVDKPTAEIETNGKMGKATSWLKKSFGKQKKRKDNGESPSPSLTSLSPSPNHFQLSPNPNALSPNPAPSPNQLSPNPAQTPSLANSPLARTPAQSPSSVYSSPGLPYLSSPSDSKLATTPDMRRQPASSPFSVALESPMIPSPTSSGESMSSPTSPSMSSMNRKNKPPRITTQESSPVTDKDRSSSGYSFEFELSTMSPRSDTFDPAPSPHKAPSSPVGANPLIGGKRSSLPPSPRQPASPHMSRSFSKRSSLLPPPTASILANEMAASPGSKLQLERIQEEERGYDAKLHAYAIRMLAELEDAQKEYDEWWSDGGIGKMDGAPPRLTVAWPFHDGED